MYNGSGADYSRECYKIRHTLAKAFLYLFVLARNNQRKRVYFSYLYVLMKQSMIYDLAVLTCFVAIAPLLHDS